MDILLPTLVALISIAGMFAADYIIEVRLTTEPDKYYPPPKPVEYTYFEQSTYSGGDYTREGDTSDIFLGPVPENSTKVRVEFNWNDDYGSNDIFRITITVNGTEAGFIEGDGGALSLEAEVETEDVFVGNYSVLVTAVDCPGLVSPLPIDRDNGNDWSMMVFVTIREEV